MSQIIATTLSNGSVSVPTATVVNGSAKAWVNFDGGAGTIAARDSLNVASLTDSGEGNYTVNFSSAFGAADYTTAATAGDNASGTSFIQAPFNTTQTASAMQLYVTNSVFATTDRTNINGTFFGDLA